MSIPALIAGVIFIITYNSISSSGVIVAGGIVFIVAGLLNTLYFENNRRRAESPRNVMATLWSRITSAASVILGLSMLFFTDTFASLVPFMFGIIVAMAGATQIYIVARAGGDDRLSPWWLVVAATLIGACVYLFMQKPLEGHDPTIMLTTGISLAVFGFTVLVEGLILMRKDKPDIAAAEVAEAKPLDVEAVEADKTAIRPLDPTDDTPADRKSVV